MRETNTLSQLMKPRQVEALDNSSSADVVILDPFHSNPRIINMTKNQDLPNPVEDEMQDC